MAKRKRLTPARDSYLAPADLPPDLETKAAPFGPRRGAAPIAQVAGEAAATAALRDLSGALEATRAEGRMIEALPLDAIEEDHLIRDRIAQDPDEMAALTASLRARGQQTPIEVVDLGGGRFGLISGWRRLRALRALHEETGSARFARVQAVLRRPESAGDAYLAMVEENEIRVGLGHYERARIAARAAEQGVYPDVPTALRHLFHTASRAKRSKIGSFVVIHDRLGGLLRFPAALPERLGLALAQALQDDPDLVGRTAQALAVTAPASAAEEQALLRRLLRPVQPVRPDRAPGTGRPARAELAPGLYCEEADGALILSGPALTESFRAELREILSRHR